MSKSSFLCKWFHIGCKKPVPPTPPPALRAVAFVVFDTNNAPLPNAKVTLDATPQFVGTTNTDGYICFPEVSTSLSASHCWVVADGYEAYDHHLDLPATNVDVLVGGRIPADATHVVLPALTSSHVNPMQFSQQQLSRIRGAMWTVPGPWRFGPRPGQPNNITAMVSLPIYGDPLKPFDLNDEQKAMIARYKSFGYTHCVFGPPAPGSYHGQYPDNLDYTTSPEMFDIWLDWVQTFWDNGLAPIVFLHEDNTNFDQFFAKYDPLIRNNEKAKRLLRIVVPSGWEPTRYDWSSKTWARYCQWAREVLPDSLVFIHTVADVDAPVGTDALFNDDDPRQNPEGNAGGWARVTPYIHGWLVQTAAFEDPNGHGDPNNPSKTNFDNWKDLWAKNVRGSYYDRFHNGYAGWPRGSAWGPNVPILIIAAEYCSYWVYWQNRSYEEGCTWGDAAMAVGVDGYLDGGTVPVGTGPVPWQK